MIWFSMANLKLYEKNEWEINFKEQTAHILLRYRYNVWCKQDKCMVLAMLWGKTKYSNGLKMLHGELKKFIDTAGYKYLSM